MTIIEAKEKLTALQSEMAAYEHALGLLSYDGMVAAPRGAAANRAQTMSVLSERLYLLSTGEETCALLDFLNENKEELDAKTRRIVQLMLKSLRELRAIPMDEYLEYQTLLVEAESTWREAKEKNDYPLFEPYLARIVETVRKFAGYMAPEKAPYDVWLDTYEEGLTMERCDAFFSALKERIIPLVKRVGEAQQIDDSILIGEFSVLKQDELSHYLMDLIGIDPKHCVLATTEHPFTTEFSKHDVRITTHYYEDRFASSLFSVVHEGGHALYELGTADEYVHTVLGSGVSMGVHESQSRFYENILGRSREFAEYIFPKLCELWPEHFAGRTAEELCAAVNRAEPSLIRTEADELTYCLHIMVRYEIEKRMMAGEVDVKELPALWAELYKEYLGVDVPDDSRGVLQDTHWSGGSIGYFPSYALGSAYGAQLLRRMSETVDVAAALKAGDLSPVNAWLEENIWQHGSMYSPGELIERALGEPFDVNCYVDYLEAKYTELYKL